MACISPLSLKQKDKRVVVPCGKCNFCLQAKRSEWTFRLKQELKVCSSAFFLTFTYSDDNLPLRGDVATLVKSDVQKFMKRLRKVCPGVTLRYYFVGEYGTNTERPHYHSIMFNLPPGREHDLEKIWNLGGVFVAPCNGATIHYTTKYHLNRHVDWDKVNPGREKPFLLSQIAAVDSVRVISLAALSGTK